MSNSLYKKFSLSTVASSVALCLIMPLSQAYAQESETSEKVAEEIIAEETEVFLITGTRMKGVSGSDGAMPTVILDKSYFLEVGAQNAYDALMTIPEMGMGGLSGQVSGISGSGGTGSIGANKANGASSVSLRDLGADATLILVNGRRIASHPLLQGGTDIITNLNNIPIESIERIEILKSGAGAVYGSDAMAGVINIIMRKDYTGMVATADLGSSTENDAHQARFSFTAGIASLFGAENNLTFSVEYFKEDSLMADERDNTYQTNKSFPGGITNSQWAQTPDGEWIRETVVATIESDAECYDFDENGLCLSDITKFSTIQADVERFSVNGNFYQTVNDNLEFFTDFMFSSDSTKSSFDPNHDTLSLPGDHPQNPFDSSSTLNYMILETGARTLSTDTTSINIVTGLKGSFDFSEYKVWDWEAGVRYSQSDADEVKTGNVLRAEWNEAWRTGGYVFGDTSANSDALINSFVDNDVNRSGSNSTLSFDGYMTGDLFDIAGSTVSVVIGGELTKDKLSDTPDQGLLDHLYITEGSAIKVSGSRDSGAVFAELRLPLYDDRIILSAQGRTDWDELFGTHYTPTYNLLADIVPDQVILRVTYAEGFRAPTLGEYDKPESTLYGYVMETPDPENMPCAVQAYPFPGLENYCRIDMVTMPNLDLQPQTSVNKNLGLILKPELIDGFRFAVDWWVIDREDEIGGLLPNEIAELFPENMITNEDGGLTEVHTSLFNIGNTYNEGIDYEVSYDIDTSAGLFSFSSKYTDTISSTRQVSEARDVSEYAGYARKPTDRFNARINWRVADWNASLNYYYEGSTSVNREEGVVDRCDSEDMGDYTSCTLPRSFTYDLLVQYTGFDQLDLSVQVRNLTDEVFEQNVVDYVARKTGVGRYVNFVAKYSF